MSYVVYGPGGVATAASRCEVHGMPMESLHLQTMPGLEMLCPIGRIEQATEMAIERINAAAQVKA